MLVSKLFPIVALATSVWGWPIDNVTDLKIAARQLQGEMFTGDGTVFLFRHEQTCTDIESKL